MNYESLMAVIRANRSYRRYDSSVKVTDSQLKMMVEAARFCSSGRNLQPLRYRLVTDVRELDAVFEALKWAGYLTDWEGPAKEERPTAYLVQCLDTDLTTNCLCDDGLQIEAITLSAVPLGLGCCIIKSFNSQKLVETLRIPSNYKPLYVIAVGKPVETVVTEPMKNNDVKYYRDSAGVHHVPKRELDDLILG